MRKTLLRVSGSPSLPPPFEGPLPLSAARRHMLDLVAVMRMGISSSRGNLFESKALVVVPRGGAQAHVLDLVAVTRMRMNMPPHSFMRMNTTPLPAGAQAHVRPGGRDAGAGP